MSATFLVGCGKMGGALLQGWLQRGLASEDVTVIEPIDAAAAAARDLGVRVVASPKEIGPEAKAEIVVFAVKPQSLPDVASHYRPYVSPETVFVSIAAGKPIAFFEAELGADAAIVRCMPNTPAAVQRGITAAAANANVSDAQRTRCGDLLEAVGEFLWVDDEGLLDAVTAVSGSGPAYVFLLIEAMAAAGVAQGLPADSAARLARATVAGSGELARQSPDDAAVLRQNVTSPGGTTEAALKVLMADDGLGELMQRAIKAATDRSRELAG